MNITVKNGGVYDHRIDFDKIFVAHDGRNLLDGADCLCLSRFDQKVNCERWLGTYFMLDEHGMLGEDYGVQIIEMPLEQLEQLILNKNETL